jgi:hypothetical protein
MTESPGDAECMIATRTHDYNHEWCMHRASRCIDLAMRGCATEAFYLPFSGHSLYTRQCRHMFLQTTSA